MNRSDKIAQDIAKHLQAHEGTSPDWGAVYLDGGEGWAKVSFEIQDKMLNGYKMIHGGMVFALADTAFAYACNSRNQKTVAQHASISFLNPAYAGETLIAEAREQSVVGRSGVYNVDVKTSCGRDIAVFQGLSRTIKGQIIEEDAT